ncbi:unnamed protein product [Owenia fusiformis]|uniref:Uncharacterized protein n=1 Tax=Owenia fusiformis TaxID=6347 RepID=A0A8J1T6P5_OWEFU|nr:unnamed protein product [Owenia fusiformis]
MKLYFILLVCVYAVNCDMYLHNPRGSNNRLDEAGRERNNANRMFDSQNNNRGGYNVGSLYYYQGSKLSIEWTNQHSCQNRNAHCEVVLQYMCGDLVRDGVTTTTIPDNPAQCENYDCNTDTRYGMNEDYDYYLNCKLRYRNKGLFTADQNLNGNNRQTAINTRQNPGGTRRGYECPEERDYYPYWHPTPWKDIAILTNDATMCPYYQSESQNVKSKFACDIPREVIYAQANQNFKIPNNKEDCEALELPAVAGVNATNGVWKEFPAHGIPAPECRETELSRDNQLGNGIGGYPLTHNWTIPEDFVEDKCVLRTRYNISTGDYEGWNDTDASNNAQGNNQAAQLDLSEKYGLDDQDAAADRGYEFENNPNTQIFPNADFTLQLAINTAQLGRTFQDRSHTFAVVERPADLKDAVIHNINVRGKRGNIVQVYPGVEYDFVPNTLEMAAGEHVHFQWTGSNTNPRNNDGQGLAGTDRSNVVLQRAQIYPEGSGIAYQPGEKFGHWGRSYPGDVRNMSFLDLPLEDLQNLAVLTNKQFRGELSELDDAGTYYDLGPRKVTTTGSYHYMCTRNNNFSNRSQKGRIICLDHSVADVSVGWNGGSINIGRKAAINIEPDTFAQLQKLRIEEWETAVAEARIAELGRSINVGDGYASNYIRLLPETKLTQGDKTFTVQMKVEQPGTKNVGVYRTNNDFATWTRLDADINDGLATFEAQGGGVYVARTEPQVGVIVGVCIGLIALVAIIIGGILYFKKNPDKLESLRGGARNAGRSVQNKV